MYGLLEHHLLYLSVRDITIKKREEINEKKKKKTYERTYTTLNMRVQHLCTPKDRPIVTALRVPQGSHLKLQHVLGPWSTVPHVRRPALRNRS